MKKSKRVGLAVIAVGLVGAAALRGYEDARAPSATVAPAALRRAFGARARVVPRGEIAHVMPTYGARVESVEADVGDVVSAGALLARLAPTSSAPTPLLEEDLLGDRERLEAPIAGTVIARHLAPGDVLGPLVPPPQPPFEIADLGALELRLEVEERDAAALVVGREVLVGSSRLEARITRVSPRVERREFPLDDVASRAASRVRIAYASLPEGSDLLPFSEHDATIEAPSIRVETALPLRAILLREGRATVRVRAGLFAEERVVRLGLADAERVEVEGLARGAQVLLR